MREAGSRAEIKLQREKRAFVTEFSPETSFDGTLRALMRYE